MEVGDMYLQVVRLLSITIWLNSDSLILFII